VAARSWAVILAMTIRDALAGSNQNEGLDEGELADANDRIRGAQRLSR